MDTYPASEFCVELESWLIQYSPDLYGNLSNKYKLSLGDICFEIENCEYDSKTEGKYSEPMVLIGIYISIASLFCVLAMACDLFYGFRNRKFWYPSKYFSLNAASITVIAVAMKLPVDLSSPMPGVLDQVAKVGGLVFMCTMMSNFMPSLASMDNKSLIANVSGLSILVIAMIVNIFIQIKTHVVNPNIFHAFDYALPVPSFMMMVAYIYVVMLLLLLFILISSAISIPTSKKILEFKYQATSKTLNDQHPQDNAISNVAKLKQLVKRYWIMAETSSPQFVMTSNPLSSASGIICATSMVIYVCVVWQLATWDHFLSFGSMYRWSSPVIVVTQSIGIVVGSIAPIFRCFTVLSFKSFANQNGKQFLVFNVEKYWIEKLCEWRESHISFFSGDHRSRAHFYSLKYPILSFCIGFQKVTVVSCKILGLAPIVVIILVMHCSCYFKSLMAMLFTPTTSSRSNDINEDVSSYVLLLEDNTRLAEKTMKGISDSMNRLIQNAEKKQYNNLLNLLKSSVAFDGVGMFDSDHIQSLLSVELVHSWSLPIVSLTCIAISLPNIHKDKIDNLFKSVGEGLLYTHLVEESFNKASKYVNNQRAAVSVWHEVEYNCKWLENTLEKSAYEGKTPSAIIRLFAYTAEEILNELNRSTNSGELVEKENLPLKLIAANSMHRVAQTIMHTYERDNLYIIEDELFARLTYMIADILVACLTNIPQIIMMRCHESAIEKRVGSVAVAIELLGRTTEVIKRLETRELPNIDPDKRGFIDEWRFHLKQP